MSMNKRHLPPRNVLIDLNWTHIRALCGLTAHAESIGQTAFLEAPYSARCRRCQAKIAGYAHVIPGGIPS